MATEQKPKVAKARKATGRKLKVFQASIGFYDTVVAAPSQAAALRAWGTHQNLFADGVARLTDDDQATEAALASPEVVLRRAVGRTDPFSLKAGIPKIPDLPRSLSKTVRAALVEAAKEADRSRLDAAEAALNDVEQEHRKTRDALTAKRRALEDEERDAAAAYEEARDRAQTRVEQERAAYVKEGGK